MHYIELFVVDVVCINVFWRFNYYRRVHNRVAACWPTAPNAEVALVETNETRKWIIYGSQMTMAGGIADGCCLIIVEERPVVISERERKKKIFCQLRWCLLAKSLAMQLTMCGSNVERSWSAILKVLRFSFFMPSQLLNPF